jgi:peroxiredoxin
MNTKRVACFFGALLLAGTAAAQDRPAWTKQERKIIDTIQELRSLPDDKRGEANQKLAREIRALPAGPNKVRLAVALAGRANEGDFGHDSLQDVTTTLAVALQEQPLPEKEGRPAHAYIELAELARYEHVQVALDDPEFTKAQRLVADQEQRRAKVDFTLVDLRGRTWALKELRGKVVLLNFWATWCPPCRKEMPDLNALHDKYKKKGLVILSVSDEDETTVRKFLSGYHYSFPIALDPGRKVNTAFEIEGIPKTLVYDREGKLVTQSIDMRTRSQFEAMLAEAGLK